MKKYNSLLIENRAGLRILKFNNPKRKNSFEMVLYKELPDALAESENDDSVAIVALTGVGEYFSSGTDIKEVVATVFSGGDINTILVETYKQIKKFFESIYLFKKPLVGVINGPCIGITATAVALCDVLYASELAFFYTPFSLLGLCPEGCASYTFPKILGPSKATEMLMFHHKLTAEEAYNHKLVAEVFPNNEIEIIWQRLEKYSKLPRNSLQAVKQLTKKFELAHLEQVNAAEIAELINCWKSDIARKTAIAFASKVKNKL